MSVTRFWEEMLDGEVEGHQTSGCRLALRSVTLKKTLFYVEERSLLALSSSRVAGRRSPLREFFRFLSSFFFVFVTSINCWEDVGFPGHALYCERVFVSQQLHVYVSVCVCVFYIIYKLIYKLLGMNVFFIYKCVSKCVCVCMYCVCLCS